MEERTVPVVRRLIAALGEARGVEPMELEPPLVEWVDPEALEALLQRSPGVRRVEFTAYDHDVVVAADGTVTVDGTTYRSETR